MKSKVFIIGLLIVSLLAAFAAKCNAQDPENQERDKLVNTLDSIAGANKYKCPTISVSIYCILSWISLKKDEELSDKMIDITRKMLTGTNNYSQAAYDSNTEEIDTSKVELIADETTISYLKNQAKIECDNEVIATKLLFTFQQLFTQFVCKWKTDRHGRYKHYIIYLNKQDSELIKEWAKTNL